MEDKELRFLVLHWLQRGIRTGPNTPWRLFTDAIEEVASYSAGDLPPYNVPSPKVRIWDVERGPYGQETVYS